MSKVTSILFALMFVLVSASAYFANGNENEYDENGIELANTEVIYLSTGADLPLCDDRNQGRIYFVYDSKEFLVCWKGQHEEISMKGDTGPRGDVGKDGAKLIIMSVPITSGNCKTGGERFVLGLDEDASGNLSYAEQAIGKTFDICNGAHSLVESEDFTSGLSECQTGSGVVIHHGIDLDNSGTLNTSERDANQRMVICDGTNGANGDDASLIEHQTIAVGDSVCPKGGSRIFIADDLDDNGTLSDLEIQNGKTITLCNGIDGNDGASGNSVMESREATVSECPHGGKTITYGTHLNNTSGNIVNVDAATGDELPGSEMSVCNGASGTHSLIQVNRVEDSHPFCNGAGATVVWYGVDSNNDGNLNATEKQESVICHGTDGIRGADGSNGTVSLTKITPYNGTDCSGLGFLIQSGLDLDGSGTLETSEVSSSHVGCHGEDGDTYLTITTSFTSPSVDATASNCPSGGVKIQTGLDNDNDGVFDNPSSVETEYICHGSKSLVISSDASVDDCPSGGVVYQSGNDTNLNNTLEAGEISSTTVICNGDHAIAEAHNLNLSSLGNTGSPTPFEQALLTILNETSEPTGFTAWVSGLDSSRNSCVLMQVGAMLHLTGRDTNNDNNLEFTELATANLVCHVRDGVNGTNGTNGSNVIVTVTNITSEEALNFGTNCPNGGKIINSGLDNGDGGAVANDGTLSESEIDKSEIMCDNRHAEMVLTKLENLQDFGSCLIARQLSYGVDDNRNRLLDPEEIDFITTFCIHFYSFFMEDTYPGTDGSLDAEKWGNHIGHFTEAGGSMYYFAKVKGTSDYTALFVKHPWSEPIQISNDNMFTDDPSGFHSDGEKVYFRTRGKAPNDNGVELWVSDGTMTGTFELADINANGNSVSNDVGSWQAATVNGITYFGAYDGTSRELWMTNGTRAGTCQVSDIRGSTPTINSSNPSWWYEPEAWGNGPMYLTADDHTDSLVFVYRNWNNSAYLYKYDHSASSDTADCSTSTTANFNTEAFHNLSYLGQMSNVNYMPIALGDGSVVFESDCRAPGTASIEHCLVTVDVNQSIGEINAIDSNFSNWNDIGRFSPTHIKLGTNHFNGHDGANFHKPSWTNESGASVDESFHLSLGPSDHGVVNGVYYFAADAGNGIGRELYAYQPANTTAWLVKDINSNGGSISWGQFETVRDRLYFKANDGQNGTELWATDGTSNGTFMLANIGPGAASGNVYRITADISSIYFIADDSIHGSELWHSDGTTDGTVMLTNHNGNDDCFHQPTSTPMTIDDYYGEIIAVGPMVYYIGDDGIHGMELFEAYFFTSTTPW